MQPDTCDIMALFQGKLQQFRDVREESFSPEENAARQTFSFSSRPHLHHCSTSHGKAIQIDCDKSECGFTLNASGLMPEEVMLLLLKSSLSKFGSP